MKINSEILQQYINRVSMNKHIPIIDLDFREDGVHTRVKDLAGQAMSEGFLKMDSFEDYTSIGKVFIRNTQLFMDMLKTFADAITIEKIADYIIKLSDITREAYIVTADEQVCDNLMTKEFTYTYDVNIPMERTFFERSIYDRKLLRERKIIINKIGTDLTISVGNKENSDYVVNSMKVDGEGDVRIGFMDPLIPFFEAVGKNFTMSLATDVPALFVEETEFFTVKTLVAPCTIEGE